MVSTLSGIPKRPNLNKTSFPNLESWFPMVSTLSRIPKGPNLNKTSFPSNSDKELKRKKAPFSKWLDYTLFRKCQQGKDEKECLYFYLSSPSKDTIPFQMTYKQMLQVSITFDYLTKEGMGIILHPYLFHFLNCHSFHQGHEFLHTTDDFYSAILQSSFGTLCQTLNLLVAKAFIYLIGG